MSFDLYLQIFDAGSPAGFRLEDLRGCFVGHLTELDEDFWQLGFDQGQSTDIFLQPLPGNAALIHTLSIHRPCEATQLWTILYELLAQPGTVLHFPGTAAALTRDPNLTDHLPESLLRSLGGPRLVESGLQLRQMVGSL